MEALRAPSPVSPPSLIRRQLSKPICSLPFTHKKPNSPFPYSTQLITKSKFKTINVTYPSISTEPTSPIEEQTETLDENEKFDWFSQWYALMPVCDLDKRVPHGKKVMGLDVVVWWDKNENAWKVFDDSCPHRLAPLSEGRIDQWGRLQCVYHGWCFGGSGDCKFIPQAPRDGPPVHTFQKACVAVYPSIVQNGIVWFWPNTDPQYKDIVSKKKPPYIPELDDPSYTFQMFNRDIPYGYEILIENLMDPAHVPYAHYGIMRTTTKPRLDREGGRPLEISVNKIDKNGFTADQGNGQWNFVPPCVFHGSITIGGGPDNGSSASVLTTKGKVSEKSPRKALLIFVCMPVSPGNSRLIFVSPRNFSVWIDKIVSRWMYHIGQNLVIDSDLYLLHVEEKKVLEAGLDNWQKVCFVPTKSDANVVAFRKWLKKYGGGRVEWGDKFDGSLLPPTPPREVLLDRYWSHVVNCSSCNAAYKGLNALEVSLQVFSLASVAIVAATKQGMISVAARNTLVVAAVLCFVGSKWLSHFIYKNFRYHDYNHAFR